MSSLSSDVLSPQHLVLEVISAEERLFLGKVNFVIIPGVAGDLGVYYRHAPLLTTLRSSGVLRFQESQTSATEEEGLIEVFYVFGGIAEVQPTGVTILADTAIRGPEIDEARMKAALSLEDLIEDDGTPIDYYKAMAELANFYVADTHKNSYRHFKYKHRTFDH